jgi:hypothetical protein
MIVPMKTQAQFDTENAINAVKVRLTALDLKVPRWAEATIKACPEAMNEIIDPILKITRGQIIKEKEHLRLQLKELQ